MSGVKYIGGRRYIPDPGGDDGEGCAIMFGIGVVILLAYGVYYTVTTYVPIAFWWLHGPPSPHEFEAWDTRIVYGWYWLILLKPLSLLLQISVAVLVKVVWGGNSIRRITYDLTQYPNVNLLITSMSLLGYGGVLVFVPYQLTRLFITHFRSKVKLRRTASSGAQSSSTLLKYGVRVFIAYGLALIVPLVLWGIYSLFTAFIEWLFARPSAV